MFKSIGRYISILKAALKAKKEITKVMQDHSWKSTKFFITIINILLSLLAAGLHFLPAATAAWLIFGISALYFMANVISKMTPSKKDDDFLAALRENILKLGIKPEEVPMAPAKADIKPEEVTKNEQ